MVSLGLVFAAPVQPIKDVLTYASAMCVCENAGEWVQSLMPSSILGAFLFVRSAMATRIYPGDDSKNYLPVNYRCCFGSKKGSKRCTCFEAGGT